MPMSLIVSYIPLVAVGIMTFLFAPLAWMFSRFIRPRKPTRWMENTYECGSEPIGDAHIQFKFQYYAFALIFVVFDLIATFLMVWAVAYSGLPASATVWMLVLLGIMVLGVAYALKKEATIWI